MRFSSLYQKCGPNEAMIISGLSETGQPRILVGGGSIVLPLMQKKEIISLEVMSIDLKSTTSYTSGDQSVYEFDGVIEAAIGSHPEQIKHAAQQLGGKDIRDIRSIIYDIAQDSIRKSLAGSNDKKISNTNIIIEEIKHSAQEELRRYGIEIHGLRVREVRLVKRIKDNSTNSQIEVPQLTESVTSSNGSLAGAIAIVSKAISNNEIGEVTYKIANSSQRIVMPAKQKIPAKTLEAGSPVIIHEVSDDHAIIEPWTEVYLHYPTTSG